MPAVKAASTASSDSSCPFCGLGCEHVSGSPSVARMMKVSWSGRGGMTFCTTWLTLAPVGVSSAHVVAS